MTEIDLSQAKKTSENLSTILTQDGTLVLIIDTNKPIATSAKGSPLFALTHGIQGTPWGQGIFLNIVVGKQK